MYMNNKDLANILDFKHSTSTSDSVIIAEMAGWRITDDQNIICTETFERQEIIFL